MTKTTVKYTTGPVLGYLGAAIFGGLFAISVVGEALSPAMTFITEPTQVHQPYDAMAKALIWEACQSEVFNNDFDQPVWDTDNPFRPYVTYEHFFKLCNDEDFWMNRK